MTPPVSPPPDKVDSTVAVRISNGVVAKIAAYHAQQIPGVSRLQPRPAAAAAQRIGQVVRTVTEPDSAGPRSSTAVPLSSSAGPLNADGVQADVDDHHHTATISIDIVIDAGHPCLPTAAAIQQDVDTHIRSATGLSTTVTVNIVDINIPDL